ncbi:MAG: long-chain-fatty-acid--CoA ligase [Deltaproteobacteria bacterium]|nr:long-chain-fatty-acid--CoA ligase [Deltaproteobacteria bacterium]
MNIAELALKSLSNEHVSIIFEGREYTNVQMDRLSRKLGNALKKIGINRGDRVIVQMPNCPEVFQTFQAVWKIGAVNVPINFQVGAEEISYIYQDSGANTVVTAPEYLDRVRAAQINNPGVKNVIMVSSQPIEGTISFYELIDENSDQLEMLETEDDEVAALVYTSGTTGKPKGVMQTHYGLYYTAINLEATISYPQDTVNMAMLPLCHSYGIGTMNAAFLRANGCTVVLRQFNVEQLFHAIEKYKVTSVAAVPTMYVYMLLYPDYAKYDLSSVKYYICGSAPLSVQTWKQFKEKFGGEIAEGWGLTEACANNTVNPVDGQKKVGSIGKPMRGMEIKIFDGHGREVPQGKEGEIVIRGPMVMKGYWNQPEATAEVIRDGWLHTGDIGYVDKDGYFFITDRKKDIIIKGGENISPRAIEEVLYMHPAVAEAAVIGMKDTVYGENIRAFAALKPGQSVSAEELLEYCKSKLKKFFVPKEITILPTLPKSLVGKILKKELRKL